MKPATFGEKTQAHGTLHRSAASQHRAPPRRRGVDAEAPGCANADRLARPELEARGAPLEDRPAALHRAKRKLPVEGVRSLDELEEPEQIDDATARWRHQAFSARRSRSAWDYGWPGVRTRDRAPP